MEAYATFHHSFSFNFIDDNISGQTLNSFNKRHFVINVDIIH